MLPAYLPDVKGNFGGWNSTLIVRNNTPGTGNLAVTYYDGAGNPVNSTADIPIVGHGVVSQAPPNNFAGLANVGAQQDSVVLVQTQNGAYTADAYNGIAATDASNPGWGRVNTSLYAPVIMNDFWGWNTDIILLNAGSATANVTITYYQSGYYTQQSFPVAPNGSAIPGRIGAANTLYSARIVSNQPLVAVVRQSLGNIYCSYNALSASSIHAYGPVIMNNYWGWDTSINVQNTSALQATVYVYYYDQAGNPVGPSPAHAQSVPPYSTLSYYSPSETFLPSGFLGTVRIAATRNVALVVNQSGPHGQGALFGMAYAGTPSGATANAVIPDVRNYFGPENWVSSINVQNLGSSPTVATLTYGGQNYPSPTINPRGMHSFYTPSFLGTTASRAPATVSASGGQPIAVVVNHSSANPLSTDLALSYNAWNR